MGHHKRPGGPKPHVISLGRLTTAGRPFFGIAETYGEDKVVQRCTEDFEGGYALAERWMNFAKVQQIDTSDTVKVFADVISNGEPREPKTEYAGPKTTAMLLQRHQHQPRQSVAGLLISKASPSKRAKSRFRLRYPSAAGAVRQERIDRPCRTPNHRARLNAPPGYAAMPWQS